MFGHKSSIAMYGVLKFIIKIHLSRLWIVECQRAVFDKYIEEGTFFMTFCLFYFTVEAQMLAAQCCRANIDW